MRKSKKIHFNNGVLLAVLVLLVGVYVLNLHPVQKNTPLAVGEVQRAPTPSPNSLLEGIITKVSQDSIVVTAANPFNPRASINEDVFLSASTTVEKQTVRDPATVKKEQTAFALAMTKVKQGDTQPEAPATLISEPINIAGLVVGQQVGVISASAAETGVPLVALHIIVLAQAPTPLTSSAR